MKNPHFFKAFSRIGIQNKPFGQNESAGGVEEAPDFILTDNFLNKFQDPSVSNFHFTLPENIDSAKYFDVVLKESIDFKNKILSELEPSKTQVVIGGDHSVTYSSLLADAHRFGTNMGVIHFDSHADFNLYNESPTKNFHGMYLRILFDEFDLPSFNMTAPQKIPINNLLFVGDLELDSGEKAFLEAHKMNVTSSNNLDLEKVGNFVKKIPHIHISFDVDVFKKDLVSATGTPSNKGFDKNSIFKILEIIKQASSLTLDVAEVNPKKEGANQTIQIAQEVILKLIS